jgi:hypothetical protein
MDDQRINIEDVRLPRETVNPGLPKRPPTSRYRQDGKFLKGPIPLDWLSKAADLPGKALHVGLAVWFWVGIKKQKEVPLSLSRLKEWGVDRFAASRGLKSLEQAGLVSTSRRKGKKAIVTLLDARRKNETEIKKGEPT